MTESNADSDISRAIHQNGDGVNSDFIATQTLVSGKNNTTESSNKPEIFPFIGSDVGLSFWGGIDETTGIVIDNSHPLCGQDVSNKILALPSGRGSCTASQVLLELILNRKAPKALILRDRDGLICVGALVAKCCVLPETEQDDDENLIPVLDILRVEKDEDLDSTNGQIYSISAFDAMIQSEPKFGSILPDGKLVVGTTVEEVEQKLENLALSSKESNGKDKIQETMLSDNEFEFKLSPEEENMLQETSTAAERRAVDVLIRYARIVTPPGNIPSYIDVKRAHIDGHQNRWSVGRAQEVFSHLRDL